MAVNLTNIGVTGSTHNTRINERAAKPYAYMDAPSRVANAKQPGIGAQQSALQQMQERAATGYTGLDRMAQQRATDQNIAGAQSQQAGMMQRAQMRGLAGGSNPFAMAQSAQQGAANRAMHVSSDIASQGVNRQVMANQQLGQAGGQMQRDAMDRGAAADAFSQWKHETYANQRQADFQYGEAGRAIDEREDNAVWDAILK